jgi:hypothetical protein
VHGPERSRSAAIEAQHDVDDRSRGAPERDSAERGRPELPGGRDLAARERPRVGGAARHHGLAGPAAQPLPLAVAPDRRPAPRSGPARPRSRRRSRSRARSVASGASWCPSLYRLRREPGSSGGCRSCPPPGQPATTAGRRPPVASRSSSPATSLNRTLVSCGCTARVTPAGQGRRGGGIGVMRGEVDAMHSRGPVSSPRDCARWFSRSPVC